MNMYRLSDRCILEVRRQQNELIIVILNTNSGKFIEVPANRWASFLLLQVDIEEALKQLQERKFVSYFEHFGGGWYASVSTGIWCVDLRQFYRNEKLEIKPTKQGLALRISEWNTLVNLLPAIMSFDEDLLAVCSMREDHLNDPNIVLGCRECSPFADNA
jgi:Transcriptional Coactivator p15 (PC4)